MRILVVGGAGSIPSMVLAALRGMRDVELVDTPPSRTVFRDPNAPPGLSECLGALTSACFVPTAGLLEQVLEWHTYLVLPIKDREIPMLKQTAHACGAC